MVSIKLSNFRTLNRNFVLLKTTTHLVNELYEGSPLDLYWVVVSVEKPDHEVEKVGLAQVGRRLLGVLDPANVGAEIKRRIFKFSTYCADDAGKFQFQLLCHPRLSGAPLPRFFGVTRPHFSPRCYPVRPERCCRGRRRK